MRKFKIKNRRKRKYVKKNELAASYSSVQSLTVGLAPLLLMTVAFFTTVLMYNPPAISIYTLPKVSFALPEVPTITIPTPGYRFSFPEIPEITAPNIIIPNPVPFLAALVERMSQAVNVGTKAIVTSVSAVTSKVASAIAHTLTLLDPRPGLSTVGATSVVIYEQASVSIVSGVADAYAIIAQSLHTNISGTIQTMITMGNAVQHAYTVTTTAIGKFIVQVATSVIRWIHVAIATTINAINSFIWFLGTPFRALHAYSVEASIAMAPYLQFVQSSLQEASDGLAKGGETIVNGSVYVTSTVEHNQQKK